MKIDANNYFVESHGVFLAQPTSWARAAREATMSRKPLRLGNRIWHPIAKTGREVTACGYEKLILRPSNARWTDVSADQDCRSFYWVSEDGTHLMRLSDHWSDVISGIRTATVGHVASCWWALNKNTKRSRNYDHGFALCIIAFADMW